MISALLNAGCHMLSRSATDPGEVVVSIQYLGKRGKTNAYRIPFARIPHHRNIPNDYQLLGGASYEITTDAIDFGDTIVTFRAQVNSLEEFQRLRILELKEYELDESGYIWRDCTLGDNGFLIEPSRAYDEWLSKFSPNFENKQISCALTDRFESNNYFAIAFSNNKYVPVPTEIATEVVRNEPTSNNQTLYTLSLKNIGDHRLEQVNFNSTFDVDTAVVSFKSEQGRCQRTDFGSSFGSIVCYVGPLAPGQATSVELIAERSRLGGLDPAKKFNEAWTIMGVAKARDDDYWGSVIEVQPLLKQ